MLHLILKSNTDEGFGRNVYKNVFFLSLYIYIYNIYIYVLISSISICNKNRYRNSEKTHSFKRFGQSLHQYDFPKSDGAYI